MPLYRIKDWDALYENHESKRIKSLRYVIIPNKHDGKGYNKIAMSPDNIKIFTAWILLLQIASKCPIRGILSEDAECKLPLKPEDFSLKTRYPEEIFEIALPFLLNKAEWIEEIKDEDIERILKERNEGLQVFVPPSKEEIKAFIKENDINVNPDKFYNFYSDRNWKIGKRKLDDWKEKIVEWENTEFNRPEKPAEQLKQLFIPDEIKKEFDDFLEMRKKIRKPASERAKELVLLELNKLAPKDYNKQKLILNQSIRNSWQDVYELKQNGSNNNGWKS